MRPETIEMSVQNQSFRKLVNDFQGQKLDKYLMIFANYKPSKNNQKLLTNEEEIDFKRLLKCIIEYK